MESVCTVKKRFHNFLYTWCKTLYILTTYIKLEKLFTINQKNKDICVDITLETSKIKVINIIDYLFFLVYQ